MKQEQLSIKLRKFETSNFQKIFKIERTNSQFHNDNEQFFEDEFLEKSFEKQFYGNKKGMIKKEFDHDTG